MLRQKIEREQELGMFEPTPVKVSVRDRIGAYGVVCSGSSHVVAVNQPLSPRVVRVTAVMVAV